MIEVEAADGYPPLFHFIAGIPKSRRLRSRRRLRDADLARVHLELMFALVANSSGIRRPNPWTIVGLLLGCTPMVVFLSARQSTLSGLTTALASVIWASGIIIVAPTTSAPMSLAYPVFLISATLFPLLRRDALFFEVAIFMILLALARPSKWPGLSA